MLPHWPPTDDGTARHVPCQCFPSSGMVGVMVDRSVSAWAQKGSQAMQMRCLTLYPQPAESNLYGRQPPTHEATTCNNGYQPSTALLPMPNWDREWAGPMKNLNLVRPSTDKKKHILPVCVIESRPPAASMEHKSNEKMVRWLTVVIGTSLPPVLAGWCFR